MPILTSDGKQIEKRYTADGKSVRTVYNSTGDIVFEEINTADGTLPQSFKSKGKALVNYRIYGNTVQNGTPTPENPVEVQGCGVRTKNIFNSSFEQGYIEGQSGSMSKRCRTPLNDKLKFENTTITLTSVSEIQVILVAYESIDSTTGNNLTSNWNNLPYTAEIDKSKYYRILVRKPSNDTIYPSDILNFMIVEGSTAPTQYIPYGYKIDIISAYDANTYTFEPIQEGTGTPSPTNVRPILPGLSFERDDGSVLDVYGGNITFNLDGTSAITSNYEMFTYNGSEEWNSASEGGWYLRNAYSTDVNQRAKGLCNWLDWNPSINVSVADLKNNQISYPRTTGSAYQLNTKTANAFPTIEEWKAQLQSTPLQVLAIRTAQTYNLSVSETKRATKALDLIITTPVYIGQSPLYKIGDYADYVDYKRGGVVRLIDPETMTVLSVPMFEPIADLAKIPTFAPQTVIDADMTVKPSKIWYKYKP